MQLPVPPSPVEPGPMQHVFAFLVLYLSILSMVFLVLPGKRSRRIVEIAHAVERTKHERRRIIN